MKIQNLSFNLLLAIATTAITTNPASSQSSEGSKISFSCQTEAGIPTTIVKTENGNIQPIFYWKSQALPTEANPEQLCESVSQQLENHLFSDSDLSSMGFKSTKLEKVPVICATDNNNDCSLVLFTLPPAENPVETANFVLASILEPQLQSNKFTSSDRGVQSIYYKVNLWELLGL